MRFWSPTSIAGLPLLLAVRPPTSGLASVQSLHGISHNKIEDTKEEHLELAVAAFDKLADKATRWIENPP